MYRYLFACILVCVVTSPSFAGFQKTEHYPAGQGGFQGPSASYAVNTVAEVLKAGDDTPCVVEGSLISRGAKHDKYVFQDSTGTITVEIDDDIFMGRTVTPENRVRLHGEVDTKFAGKAEIEVDRMEVIQ